MLALVDDQFVTIAPTLVTGDVSVSMEGSQVVARVGGQKIEAGVRFYAIDPKPDDFDVQIDVKTGAFNTRGSGMVRFRAIIAGRHYDINYQH